jgi:hypothetical protein
MNKNLSLKIAERLKQYNCLYNYIINNDSQHNGSVILSVAFNLLLC